jgi:hypothetical protein
VVLISGAPWQLQQLQQKANRIKLCLSADDMEKRANQGWEDRQERRNTIDVG